MVIDKRHQLLTPREASRMLGISYPTIKKWILEGKIETVQTPGGHHRLSLATLQPFLQADSARPERGFPRKISAGERQKPACRQRCKRAH